MLKPPAHLLDGAERPDDRLARELRHCADCRAEFESLDATLRITKRLREAVAPAETYWPGYHARLGQKLAASLLPEVKHTSKQSWLVRLFKTSVPVPIPVAVALLVAFVVLLLVVIRPKQQPPIPAPHVVQVPVEVPVVQEKIVTRVVYRERPSSPKTSKRRLDVEGTFARSQKPRSVETPATLAGFKPADEVKLTVIKGGSANEK